VRIPALLLCLSFLVLANTSCFKSDTCDPNPVANEAAAIEAYAANQGLSPIAHESGLYYQIFAQGTGETPANTSKVFITYTGKLADGTIFDDETDSSLTGWDLGRLIPGWQIGLSMIQEGGHIRLIIPSALAYGCKPYGAIPANSFLDFDIHLIDVVN